MNRADIPAVADARGIGLVEVIISLFLFTIALGGVSATVRLYAKVRLDSERRLAIARELGAEIGTAVFADARAERIEGLTEGGLVRVRCAAAQPAKASLPPILRRCETTWRDSRGSAVTSSTVFPTVHDD